MIYLNGHYCDAGFVIDGRDRGFLLGDGVFETVLLKEGRPVFLQDHLQRLKTACDALEIPYPQSENNQTLDFFEIIHQLSMLMKCDVGKASARITVSRGVSGRGLVFPPMDQANPTLMVVVNPFHSPPDYYKSMVSQYVRGRHALSSHYKTLNYLENIMAKNEATQNGCDEAIMLNEVGRIACGSTCNLFMVTKDNHLLTPSLEEGALPGITRKKILEIASTIGVDCMETEIEINRLTECDLFFTNSLIEIINHENVSNPVINTLKQHYAKLVLDYGHDLNG